MISCRHQPLAFSALVEEKRRKTNNVNIFQSQQWIFVLLEKTNSAEEEMKSMDVHTRHNQTKTNARTREIDS